MQIIVVHLGRGFGMRYEGRRNINVKDTSGCCSCEYMRKNYNTDTEQFCLKKKNCENASQTKARTISK